MTQNKGRYVYGIGAKGSAVRLGSIGIEGNEVYTIPYKGLYAIVHNCPAEPYQSDDSGRVQNWVRTHQNVLDEAKKQFGTIIPLGFDTILMPENGATYSARVVKDWLKEDYQRLRLLMEKIANKDEYVVQVLLESSAVSQRISEQNESVKKLKEEMVTKSSGVAYLYQQRLEKVVKAEIAKLADEWFRDFYQRIKCHCDEIVVEKCKRVDRNRVMLLNLSCLVAQEEVDNLGMELEEINHMPGFSVHFSGPWPPYSFVTQPILPVTEEMK